MKFSVFLVILFQFHLTIAIRSWGQSSAADKHLKGFEKSHGSSRFDAFNTAHGETNDKIYKSDHHHRKGSKGFFDKALDHSQYGKEYGGKKVAAHPKHLSAGSKHGAEFGESEYYKNNRKHSGYGELYDADALDKHRSFYDRANKKGRFSKYGKGRDYFSNHQKGQKSGGSSRGNQQSHAYKIIKR